ncbi:MAG: hypothetical protein ABF264_07795 [Flavobacteriales bacterium]|jgi:tetratricopeptide (TPR) repeat protein
MIWLTLYKKLLQFRLYIGIALVAITIALGFTSYDGWFWFSLILAFIALGSHVFFGPIRFIQEAIQAGDMERAKKFINQVYFPRLLFKPVRQGFYMLQSNMAMAQKDFASAETLMNKSIKSKSKALGSTGEGSSYLQLGMIAAQNGKMSEAKKNLRIALDKGLGDKETKATAYLQLAGLEMQSRRFGPANNYFKKAKQLNPQTSELKDQIAQMEKYIHRRG